MIVQKPIHLLADADNQGAYEIVKEHDPEGSRTIGKYLPCIYILILTPTFHRSRNQAGSDREGTRRKVVQPTSQQNYARSE